LNQWEGTHDVSPIRNVIRMQCQIKDTSDLVLGCDKKMLRLFSKN
jgi:hypothetical protein